MNISFKPIIVSALVIFALFLVGGFINDAVNGSNKPSSVVQMDSKEKEYLGYLDNIAKIEGQKITAVDGSIVKLENNEKVDFGTNEIKCQVGDIIENYTVANQSLVCIRKDNNGNVLSSIIMPLATGIAGGILGNYITSKLFASNNGLSRMPNSYDYRNTNGDVFNSQPAQVSSYSNNQSSNYRRSFGTSRGTGLGGLLGGFGGGNNGSKTDSGSNTAGSNNSGVTKSTGTTGGSKGGISTGSKGGTGGG
jgi:hypothetical protein